MPWEIRYFHLEIRKNLGFRNLKLAPWQVLVEVSRFRILLDFGFEIWNSTFARY